MSGQNNHKIHEYGKELCLKALIRNGYEIEQDEARGTVVSINGKKYILSANIKPSLIKGINVTGKNKEQIAKLEIKQALNNCDDVLLVFFDLTAYSIYSNTLSELMRSFEFEGIVYPKEEITHSGIIVYWPVIKMKYLSDIKSESAEHISILRYHNKFPKEQKSLF